jgi:hypothetical protein
MPTFRKVTLLLAAAILCDIYTTAAQIIVTAKPIRPAYSKRPAPGPTHVWVADDWIAKDTAYVWNGDRWAEPPERNAVWVPGKWKHTHEGWRWTPGKWR